MTRARRLLGPIGAIWLVCQVATLAVGPAVLEASLAACSCRPGADATCPMHQKPATGSTVCVMQSITTRVPATLNGLFSIVGLIPDPPLAMALTPTASAARPESMTAMPRPSPPDPPPPRA